MGASDRCPVAYDPAARETIQSAFNDAWELMPNHLKYPDRLRAMIAIQIFEAAARGELGRERFCRDALRRVLAPPSPAVD